jgi:hypothetical protein
MKNLRQQDQSEAILALIPEMRFDEKLAMSESIYELYALFDTKLSRSEKHSVYEVYAALAESINKEVGRKFVITHL